LLYKHHFLHFRPKVQHPEILLRNLGSNPMKLFLLKCQLHELNKATDRHQKTIILVSSHVKFIVMERVGWIQDHPHSSREQLLAWSIHGLSFTMPFQIRNYISIVTKKYFMCPARDNAIWKEHVLY